MCENMILMPNIFLEGEKSSNKYNNPSDPVGAPWCMYGISGYVRSTPKSQKNRKFHHIKLKMLQGKSYPIRSIFHFCAKRSFHPVVKKN